VTTEPESWTELDIGGRPCWLFEPRSRNEHGYAALYLHDLDEPGRPRCAALVEELSRAGMPIIAPVTGRSWWVDRPSPDFDQTLSAEVHVLDNVLPWIVEHLGVAPPQIALLGVGMGGQGALRLSYRHPNQFPVVAGISPLLDFQQFVKEGDEILNGMYADPESARQDTAILHLHPLNWPRNQFFCCHPQDHEAFEGADRLRMKLSSIGILCEHDLESAPSPPGPDYTAAMAEPVVRFLAERLDRERLRIV